MSWVVLMACAAEPAEPRLVPEPSSMVFEEGVFELRASARIVATGEAGATAELLAAGMRAATGFALPVVGEPAGRGDIELVLDPSLELEEEGYTLVVEERVLLSASDEAGLFWGTQTLRQLFAPELLGEDLVDRDWQLPRLRIADQPRYSWRGSMIDVARHFYDLDFLRAHVDAMALHKLNRLHLHLSDDQGWRLEIRSWPALTEVGGRTEVGGGEGGFYTQEDYAAFVAYAAARHVVVVPEIDLPGHCNAALSSYGELNPDGQPTAPYTGVNVGFSSLWLEGPATWRFVADVLGEVAALTPGPWVHVGGDESKQTSESDYRVFLQGFQEILAEHGKTLVAWDEVAGAELQAPFLAQQWNSEDKARAASGQGAQVIRSPAGLSYLDMMYGDEDGPLGAFWAGFIGVEKAYAWSPALDGVDVIGVEAPLWTEVPADEQHAWSLIWPRLSGIAELGWRGEPAPWEDYRARLAWHGQRLDALGIDFYRSPEVDWAATQR